jgi:ABC-type sugar transport system ATPase subunit
MAEITLQGVTKSWGAVQAVKEIEFQVREGSFAVLLGPSGCG